MGEELGPEADRINRAFIDCVRAGTAIVRAPVPGGRWKKGLDGRRVLEKFFYSRLAQKRAQPGDDLFSHLCQAQDEHGRKFSDDDVVNHMIFLMMAAHDTSTITLCSMFYQLAKHPEWQERLRREAFALGKRDLEYPDLEKLADTSLVMKEALRLLTPVHGIPRKTTRDVEFKGYHIPAGTFIAVSPIVTHRLPEWWSNPEAFDPERFSEGRAEHKKHMYQYVPFGGGAHMCIGLHFAEMQVKAILHHVLQRYRWSVPSRYRMPADFTSLPVPADKLPVRLERL
jgi:cytochrome P450